MEKKNLGSNAPTLQDIRRPKGSKPTLLGVSAAGRPTITDMVVPPPSKPPPRRSPGAYCIVKDIIQDDGVSHT